MGYRPVDRDQLFLLPPSIRDWLPSGHLAFLVEDVVGRMDTSRLHAFAQLGGVGRAGYDPDMLFMLLVYGYAEGVHSSRKIESKCAVDLAFRYLCAQDAPDHTVIARFRRRHADALGDLLAEVLIVAVRLGMGRLGHIAIDGTKIQANASRAAQTGVDTLRRLARELVADGIAEDDAEDIEHGQARGDELPIDLRDRSRRGQRITDAVDKAEQREVERAREVADAEAKLHRAQRRHEDAIAEAQAADAARQSRQDADGIRLNGRKPNPIQRRRPVLAATNAVAKANKRLADLRARHDQRPVKVNLTDPDCRFLPVRGGWCLGYNCMFSVSDDLLILGYDIHDSPDDADAFLPMMTHTQATIARIGQATGTGLTSGIYTADAGFDTDANLTAAGPDRLIAQTRRDTTDSDPDPPPPEATARQHMAYRLATPDGQAIYRRRSITVEPVNGHIKDRVGLRRFNLRRTAGAHIDLGLAAIAHNIRRIHSFLTTPTATATAENT